MNRFTRVARATAPLALTVVALGFGVAQAAPASADVATASWGRITGDYHPTYVPYVNGTITDTKYDGACAVVYADFGSGYTRNSYLAGGTACGYGKTVSWEISNGWAASHTYAIREELVYKDDRGRYSTLCGPGGVQPNCKNM